MRRLLAFLDPLLGRAPLIIEAHDRTAGQAQIRDDEADSRKQFPEVKLHFATTRRHKRAVGTPLITLEPALLALVANPLCREQEKRTICESKVQIGKFRMKPKELAGPWTSAPSADAGAK